MLKSAMPLLMPRGMKVPGEHTKTGRHQSDCPLSDTGPSQPRAAGKLFDACDRGDVVIVVLPVVRQSACLCSSLSTRHPRANIASTLGRLISSPGVEISEVGVHLDALKRYEGTKVHFVDCVIAATGVAKNASVSTFDQPFRKFVDVRLETE